jgi:hypothetical protein
MGLNPQPQRLKNILFLLAGSLIVFCGLLVLALLSGMFTSNLIRVAPSLRKPTSTRTVTFTPTVPTLTPSLTRTPVPSRTPFPSRTLSPTITPTLAFTPADTLTPTLSPTPNPNVLLPSGPWLVVSGTGGVWAMNPDGQVLTKLVGDELATVPDLKMAVSPTGGRLAVLASTTEDQLRLNIYKLPDAKLEISIPIVSSIGASPQFSQSALQLILDRPSFAWSPDGNQLALTAVRGRQSVDLFLYNLTDRHLERLTNLSGQAFAPFWTPDGDKVMVYELNIDSSGIEWISTWAINLKDEKGLQLDGPASSVQVFTGWSSPRSFYTYRENDICGGYDLRQVDIDSSWTTPMVPACFSGASMDPESTTVMVTVDDAHAVACPCSEQRNPAGVLLLPQGIGLPHVVSTVEAFGVDWQPNARLFLAASQKGWFAAYRSDGRAVRLPEPVVGGIPEVSAASGVWVWVLPQDSGQPGVWMGSPGETPLQVYKGPAILPQWDPSGKNLLFFDDGRLFIASAQNFTPILQQTFPTEIRESTWVYPTK